MKIAIAGKGGVGKTFISATLARLLADDGYKVLAIDADPNINLGYSLGIPREVVDNIIPLTDNEELVEEKTGVAPTEIIGPVFNMAPTVDDIVDRFGVDSPSGVRLLVMGTVKGGGSGCMCGANALLRVLVQHLLIQRGEVLVMDMVAGLEHLGRGTARRMDGMLVVLEPRMKSVDTMKRVLRLAEDIDVKDVLAVGNKVANEREKEFIEKKMQELEVPIAAYIPYDNSVAEADMNGVPAIDFKEDSSAINALKTLKTFIVERYNP